MENTNWFELKDIVISYDNSYNIDYCRKVNKKVSLVNPDSNYSRYDLDYVKITAKLVFTGSLNTPRGNEPVAFDYYVKTTMRDLLDEGKISIYEQTFTGLNEAVTIRFSSGSIISKIVFGDIEQAFRQLKTYTLEEVRKYCISQRQYNEEFEKKKEEEEKNED